MQELRFGKKKPEEKPSGFEIISKTKKHSLQGRSLGNGYFIVSKAVRKWGPYWWLLKYVGPSGVCEWRCLGPTIECKHRTSKPKMTLQEAIEEALAHIEFGKKGIPIREKDSLVRV